MLNQLRYHLRLVYKDSDGERHISEFNVETWRSAFRVIEWVFEMEYELVFITISDNEEKTRLQGPKGLVTFYDLTFAIHIVTGGYQYEELTPVFVSYLGDFIKSHEVKE